MMKVVLDTSVVVAAARSRRGASSRLLDMLADGRFAAAISAALVLEYEEVLRREVRPDGWSEADVSRFLDSMCALCEHHVTTLRIRPLLRDPDDDFLVELAATALADYIVTHNVRDFDGCESAGVHIVTPGQFLQILAGRS